MTSNSWQMDPRLGLTRGEAPDLFSSNLKKKVKEKKWGAEKGMWVREHMCCCQRHFQGSHLGRVGALELSVSLQQEPLPYQKNQAVEDKRTFYNKCPPSRLTFHFLGCFGGNFAKRDLL